MENENMNNLVIDVVGKEVNFDLIVKLMYFFWFWFEKVVMGLMDFIFFNV